MAKGVQPNGVLQNGSELIIPARQRDGSISTYQRILADGTKLFMQGGKAGDSSFQVGDVRDVIYVAEGYTTAATTHQATGEVCVVAFNAGNLMAVAKTVRDRHPDIPIVIAGDDDIETDGNPGRAKAEAAAAVGGVAVFPTVPTDFNDMAAAVGMGAVREVLEAAGAPDPWPEPVDPFGDFVAPPLPRGVLPKAIEDFAFVEAELMGVDPAGIAIPALASCASVISDLIKIQVKIHDKNWIEAARLWVMAVGMPSAKKTPAISAATSPVKRLQGHLFHKYREAIEKLQQRLKDGEIDDEQFKEQKPNPPRRLFANDTTIEALQDILAGNPDGILLERDELVGWIGSMEKYSSSKGAGVDRAFWLTAWNGGPYQVDRVQRGSTYIPNLSVSLVGGIQPDVIAKSAKEMQHDGLLQRFLPIQLQPATVGEDKPVDEALRDGYVDVIRKLHRLLPPSPERDGDNEVVKFNDAAQTIRSRFAAFAADLAKLEHLSPKFTAWAGKLDSAFARMCLVFHAIEWVASVARVTAVSERVTEQTAHRVDRLFREYLVPHALRFFVGVLEHGEARSQASDIAGLILARRWERIVPSDLAQNWRPAKNADSIDIERWMETLANFGWLEPEIAKGNTRIKAWNVNPKVHERFKSKAEEERRIRAEGREVLLRAFKNESGTEN